jgi:ParB/RepB/Spo0J family partition protein
MDAVAEKNREVGSAVSANRVFRIGEKDYEMKSIPTNLIRRFNAQPRKYFNKDELNSLSDSIALIGQIVPAIVREIEDPVCKFELIDGERRWLACKLAGCPLKAIVNKGEAIDFDTQFLISVAANFGRAEHTPMEIALAIETLKKSIDFLLLPQTEAIRRVAKIFAKSETWVSQYLSLLKLAPEVREMMAEELPKTKRINFSTAIQLANLPHEEQKIIARRIIDEKMPIYKIRFLVGNMLTKIGVDINLRRRRPSDEFSALKNFLKKNRIFLEMFFDGKVLSRIKRGDKEVRYTFSNGLRDIGSKINSLADILVMSETPASEAPIVADKMTDLSLVKRPLSVLTGGHLGGEQQLGVDDPEILQLIDQCETTNVEPFLPFRQRGQEIVADDCCLGGRDKVKVCSDVLTILNYDFYRRREQFATRCINKGKHTYVKYADDGKIEECFYGPVVLEKFFSENKVSSNNDYLKKRNEIKNERIKKFYPVNIAGYKKKFKMK